MSITDSHLSTLSDLIDTVEELQGEASSLTGSAEEIEGSASQAASDAEDLRRSAEDIEDRLRGVVDELKGIKNELEFSSSDEDPRTTIAKAIDLLVEQAKDAGRRDERIRRQREELAARENTDQEVGA